MTAGDPDIRPDSIDFCRECHRAAHVVTVPEGSYVECNLPGCWKSPLCRTKEAAVNRWNTVMKSNRHHALRAVPLSSTHNVAQRLGATPVIP